MKIKGDVMEDLCFWLGRRKKTVSQGFEPQRKQTLKCCIVCKAQIQEGKAWKPVLAEPPSCLGQAI